MPRRLLTVPSMKSPRVLGLVALVAGATFLGFSSGQAGLQVEVRYTAYVLRLRAAPCTDAATVMTLPRAAKVFVSECTGGWCAVRYPHTDSSSQVLVETSGFVAQALLSAG